MPLSQLRTRWRIFVSGCWGVYWQRIVASDEMDQTLCTDSHAKCFSQMVALQHQIECTLICYIPLFLLVAITAADSNTGVLISP